MVATKGRLNSLTDRTTQDKKARKPVGEVMDLKIYVEVGKIKYHDTLKNCTKGPSLPRKSGSYLLNATDSKSGMKNLDKGNSKPDKSMSSNVGRKVLADIGNRSRRFSNLEQGKTTRTGKGKTEMMLNPQRKGNSEKILHPESHRVAVDLGNTEGSFSSRESVTQNRIQAIDESQTSKKFITKNIKTSSDKPHIKFHGRSSVTVAATERKSVRSRLPLTRKSLPGLKQVSRVETNGTAKENSEKSANSRGKHGFPVKPSLRSIVPKPSNLNSRPWGWGNRVSDGFLAMTSGEAGLPHVEDVQSWSDRVSWPVRLLKSSRAQTKMDSAVLSRKSLKTTLQTTNTAPKTRNNARSNHIVATKKLMSRKADLSQRKEEKASVSKNVPSVESNDKPDTEEGIPTFNITRRKSDRRNSFTSSLMSRSKLAKECGKATSEETLPNIYDDSNHLEVCDYVDDIYQYYWVMEGQNPLLKNYMDTQREITPQMRGILINWLIEVHLKFDLMEETLFLTATLLDRYLSLENITKHEMQLVGLTALLLASKYEDFWHPRVTDLISISAESYTRDQMLKMEKTILKKLKFRLNEPTPYVFMLRFLKAAQSDMKFRCLAFFLIELCLVEYEALYYKPSMLCASAIYVARCTMKLNPPWTPLLGKHARYGQSQIRDCAEMILKFHKAAKTTLLKVTYEKYAKPDYCKVATIKPLDRLPAS